MRGSTNLGNTPVIIKYPFWKMTRENDRAIYACLNYGEAFCPKDIEDRFICIDGDIGNILKFTRTKTIGAGDELCDFKMEIE